MERSLWILLVLIAPLAIIHLVKAQSQKGFISLDCGLPNNEDSPYNESETGLEYRSDKLFIQSGNIKRIQGNLEATYIKPYHTLRSFPEGRRNCYNLDIEKGRKYLIRASFVYENYDGRNSGPKFDLYLGPNLWATIDLRKLNSTWEEIFHIPRLNYLHICLVKTGNTTPMISTLEIRPMRNDLYKTDSGSLKLYFRYYLSQSNPDIIRYPDDAYDRRWTPSFQPEWTQISTTRDVNNSDSYNPPKAALKTAVIPTNASEPLTIEWTNSDHPDDKYYFYGYLAEIQDLQTNETREFDVLWNGKGIFIGPIIPEIFYITTLYGAYARTCDRGYCKVQLIRTNRSTLPPLLSAWELFTVIHFEPSDTDENDVVAIKSIKGAYDVTKNSWQGDPCVPPDFTWDGLNCSNKDTSKPAPRITSLNLSSSRLTGTIAAAIQNLTQLEKLDLSNNSLIGELPEFLGNIKSLIFINLSWNDLNGSIPQALKKKGLQLHCEGNPRLSCLPHSCLKSPKKNFPVAIVASAVSAAVIAVLILVLFLRKKMSTENVTFANNKGKRFKYSEVLKMTNNFQRVLGKGGFGKVYHGTVNGSEQVAVKVLSQSSTQGYKEFKAEVDLLLRVHHTNLVSLVGYCYEGDHLALVYELLPNGDLKQHLSGKGDKSIINWSTRLRIALEAAVGLEYLHNGCTPPMVHRDVKTANILLDENLKAKLADFGLSRSYQSGVQSQDSMVIAGTPGYLDPEYFRTSQLSKKSDVYSYGVVLLEIITNQPVISINQGSENIHITQWVGSKDTRGDIDEIMDPNLRKDYDSNSARRTLELAISCADACLSKRPTMCQVINELKECIVCENSRINKNGGLELEEMNV